MGGRDLIVKRNTFLPPRSIERIEQNTFYIKNISGFEESFVKEIAYLNGGTVICNLPILHHFKIDQDIRANICYHGLQVSLPPEAHTDLHLLLKQFAPREIEIVLNHYDFVKFEEQVLEPTINYHCFKVIASPAILISIQETPKLLQYILEH